MITKDSLWLFEKQFCQAVADKKILTLGDAAKYSLDWMYNKMEAEKYDTSALTAENAQLRAALQNLLDEQNDAPLETRRAQWEQAMNEARAILSK